MTKTSAGAWSRRPQNIDRKLTSVAAYSLTIAAGPLVFSEPFPDDPAGVVLRLAAFTLVIVAAALTPAPIGAAEQLEEGDTALALDD